MSCVLKVVLHTNHLIFSNRNFLNDHWHYVNFPVTFVSGFSRNVKNQQYRKIPNIVISSEFPAIFFFVKNFKGQVTVFFFSWHFKVSVIFFFNLLRALFCCQGHFTGRCLGQQRKFLGILSKISRTIFGLTGGIIIFALLVFHVQYFYLYLIFTRNKHQSGETKNFRWDLPPPQT